MKTSTLIRLAPAALALSIGSALADSQLIQLERIVVESAVQPDRSGDDLVTPVEVLHGEELERRRAPTLGELLAHELGIANASYGPGVGRPVIRGQGGPRVQVLENGIRSMDISTIAADHAVTVDPLIARQIEVLKGPATLIYGNAASAGVVNVLNNRMPRRFEPGFTGTAAVSYLDNRHGRSGMADFTVAGEQFALQADASAFRSGDFRIPGFQEIDQQPGEGRRGVLENSSIDNRSAAVSGSFVNGAGFFGLAISRLEQDYGLPEVLDPDDLEFERITVEQTRVDLRGEATDPLPGVTRLRLALGINDFTQEEAEFEDGEREVELLFENKEWDLRIDLAHEPIGGFSGVIGLQLSARDFEAGEPEHHHGHGHGHHHGHGDFFVPPTETRSWALFAVEERPTEFGRLEFGARWERNRSRPEEGPQASFTLLSASAGALWELDELHHLKLAFNRAERAPAAEELFSEGRHAATGTYEIGDPGLRSERANNLELGLDRHGDGWQWRLNAYYNQIDAFIYQEFQVDAAGNVILVDDDGGFDGRLRNRLVEYRQADARFWGFEADTRLRVLDDGIWTTDLRLFADTVRGRLRGGEDLPRVTPPRLGAGVYASTGPFDANLDWVRTLPQRRIARGETETDGYTLLGLDLGYRFVAGTAAGRLFLRGRNLLDEEVRLHTSFKKDAAPQPGRSWLAGVRFDF